MPRTEHIVLSEKAQAILKPGVGPRVLDRIAKALDRQNELTIGATVRDRMSFPNTGPAQPDGLRVQSGRMRKSLNRALAVLSGDRLLSSIGSNLAYFGPHEFGFNGSVNVRSFQRALPRRVRFSDGETGTLAYAFGAGLINKKGRVTREGKKADIGVTQGKGTATVKAHTRKVDMPARRMVQRTILARMGEYSSALSAAVVKGASRL